ncbi:hypothetical protein KKD42_01875, partial [Patescibacteria group bacterium]|nr:hypothetical protein [Patescibacteria group bacterium]
MKILIATGIYPPDIGGPSRMLEALSRSLQDNGFEVRILAYADEAVKGDGVYRVSRKQAPFLMYIRYFLRMRELSKWSDVVYVTDVYSVGYFAHLIKKISGKKYIVRFAGDSAWEIATAKGWTNDYITDLQEKVYDKRIEKIKARRKNILANA